MIEVLFPSPANHPPKVQAALEEMREIHMSVVEEAVRAYTEETSGPALRKLAEEIAAHEAAMSADETPPPTT